MQIKSDFGMRCAGRVRKPLIIMAGIVGCLLILVLLIPTLLSSSGGRRMILAKINKAVPGKTDFGDLSIGWLKGIRVEDFSFNDAAGLVSVEAKEIASKLRYISLLVGNLNLGRTRIEQPRVEIRLTDKPAPAAGQPQPGATKAAALAIVSDVVLNSGSLKITDPKARTVELSNINSQIRMRPMGQQSSMLLDTSVGGTSSTVHIEGQVTPKQGWTLTGATGNLTVEVKNLDLGSIEAIFALAGVEVEAQGNLSANLKGQVKDGQIENLAGTVDGKQIDVAVKELQGDRLKTSALRADVKVQRQGEKMVVDNLELTSDWAKVKAAGAVPVKLSAIGDITKVESDYKLEGTFDCDVAAVMSQMPKTLKLKEGTKINAGRLSGQVQTSTVAGKRVLGGQAELKDLRGVVDGKEVALSEPVRADVRISSDKATTTFERFDVSASFAKVKCTGTMQALKYNAEFDLAKLQTEIGRFVDLGQLQMAGAVVQQGQLSSEKDKISVSGSGTVTDLRLTSKDKPTVSEPKADLSYAIDYDRKGQFVHIGSLKSTASFGQLAVKDGDVPLAKESAKPMHTVVAISNVDLAKVQPFAVAFASFPKGTRMAGVAEGEIVVDSRQDVYTIKTANTKVRGFELIAEGKKPFRQDEVTVLADVTVNPAKKNYSIRQLQIVSPQIKVDFAPTELNSNAGQTTLKGQAKLDYDWSAVGALAGDMMPKGLVLQGQRKTALEFSSRYPTNEPAKFMAGLNTNKWTLGFDGADYMGLHIGKTDINAQAKDGVLSIEPFSTSVNNGQLKCAANADFRQSPAVLKAPQRLSLEKVQINDAVSNELLSYINPIFANAANVSGLASFSAEQLLIPLGGSDSNAIDIAGDIAIDNLKLRPSGLMGQIFSIMGMKDPSAELKVHPTKFAVKNGAVRYDDMQVDVGNNPVNFKGIIGLNKSLDMTVTLPYTVGGRSVRIGQEASSARISLRLTGTIDKPKLDTSKLLEGQIEGLLQGLFEKL
jgi:hypothetical protein